MRKLGIRYKILIGKDGPHGGHSNIEVYDVLSGESIGGVISATVEYSLTAPITATITIYPDEIDAIEALKYK